MMNTLSVLLVVLALVPGPQQTTAAGATCGDHLLDTGETCEVCPGSGQGERRKRSLAGKRRIPHAQIDVAAVRGHGGDIIL